VGDLAGEVVGDVLWPVVGTHDDTACGIGFDPAEACANRLADWFECGEAAAIGGDVMGGPVAAEPKMQFSRAKASDGWLAAHGRCFRSK
jgi:hypothetical protein